MIGALRKILTVTKIDRKKGKMTFKLPDGKLIEVQAKYPEKLDRVKVGDVVAVTYTEALAVGILPAGARK